MSQAISTAPFDAAARPAAVPLDQRPWLVLLLGFALSGLMSWARLTEIWQDNTFFDTDDAMRLVQVRDWLAGQGWFDLVAHRLDPPSGVLMHWSRVVDVPVGGLIRLFALAAPLDVAERLARIVFPLALQVALIAATVRVARTLLGPAATLPAALLVVLTGFAYEQFPPGRIDHHAPQIVLLMLMSGALLAALDRPRAWEAALAGLSLALSLAISLENLPFMVVIAATLPLAWLRDPLGLRAALLWFAGSLALAVPALFAATVPPARYGVAFNDAFSIVHVTAALAGAAGLAGLAGLTSALGSVRARGIALAGMAAAAGAVVLWRCPGCLAGPYAGLDPVLKALWLSHVTEAEPLLVAGRTRPDTITMLFCPLVCGAAGAALAVWRTRGLDRQRWAAVLALIAVGIGGTLWEIRVASSAQPLAVLGGAFVVTRGLAAARRRGSVLVTAAAVASILPFTAIGWALVPMGEADPAEAAALARGAACRSSAALAPLAALPPGLVFAPIDDGSHLLVATPHAVVAAPYHRNGIGNRRVLDGFMADPRAAEAIVRGTGARYVMICPGEMETGVLAQAAPHGFGARLAAGDVPAWLSPLPLSGTLYHVFGLRDPAPSPASGGAWSASGPVL